MNHYILVKQKNRIKLKERINLYDGCTFTSKNKIVVYSPLIKNYVIKKKLDDALAEIILLYKKYLATESGDDEDALLLKIDYFDLLLNEIYSKHLNIDDKNKYKTKFNKLTKGMKWEKIKEKIQKKK